MAAISRSGTRWRAQIRRAGHKALSRTFDTKQDAARWAREQEALLDRGAATAGALQFADLMTVYREQIARSIGRSKDQALAGITALLGETRVRDLTPRAYLDFTSRRERQGAGPATILMDLSYIGTVLRHASVMADVDAVPALAALAAARKVLSHAGRVRPPIQRDRRPTDDELEALFAHWGAKRPGIPMRRLVLFAICTAMRQSEIARIRWETFDPGTRTILIPNRKHPTKKGTNHQRVPLLTGPVTIAGQVYSPIELMHEQPTRKGKVFPYEPRSVSASMTRAVAALKLPDLTFHDLRHDAVSRMFEYGLSIEQVAVCSGHNSWQQLKRYTNIRPESLHRD